MNKKTDEFFARLKVELDNSTQWPAEYLFKFIVPTTEANVKEVENAFNGLGAVIKTTKSKNQTFTSVSINVQMASAQAVVDKYIELSTIEGIISL
ncbi:MAG: DUF493 family protein [Flavobacterium sp.]|nr:DUF493 family protein [Flavobacterium sp.]